MNGFPMARAAAACAGRAANASEARVMKAMIMKVR